ncbi:hypothetical protein ABLE93_08905 [Xanthobacter sp. KR7-65]|uniref:hypothetical protein n=1 Tax=Xanthobacter sp. KR7-65 TaxID=3156612 RepID=UPI0032B4CFDB
MDLTDFVIALLVIGAPLALFLSLRRGKPSAPAEDSGATPGPAARQDDYGLAREDSPRPAPAAETPDTSAAARGGGAAAAAGGAFIIAAGVAQHHASEGGGESPHVGHGDGGPDSDGDGAGGDGGGGGGGGDGGGGGGGD